MNNRCFTTIEIVVSFALVVIILTSLTAIVVNYRDEVTDEEIKTQLLDFKNTITKVIYDDITEDEYNSLTSCGASCVSFVKSDGSSENLEIIVQE